MFTLCEAHSRLATRAGVRASSLVLRLQDRRLARDPSSWSLAACGRDAPSAVLRVEHSYPTWLATTWMASSRLTSLLRIDKTWTASIKHSRRRSRRSRRVGSAGLSPGGGLSREVAATPRLAAAAA